MSKNEYSKLLKLNKAYEVYIKKILGGNFDKIGCDLDEYIIPIHIYNYAENYKYKKEINTLKNIREIPGAINLVDIPKKDLTWEKLARLSGFLTPEEHFNLCGLLAEENIETKYYKQLLYKLLFFGIKDFRSINKKKAEYIGEKINGDLVNFINFTENLYKIELNGKEYDEPEILNLVLTNLFDNIWDSDFHFLGNKITPTTLVKKFIPENLKYERKQEKILKSIPVESIKEKRERLLKGLGVNIVEIKEKMLNIAGKFKENYKNFKKYTYTVYINFNKINKLDRNLFAETIKIGQYFDFRYIALDMLPFGTDTKIIADAEKIENSVPKYAKENIENYEKQLEEMKKYFKKTGDFFDKNNIRIEYGDLINDIKVFNEEVKKEAKKNYFFNKPPNYEGKKDKREKKDKKDKKKEIKHEFDENIVTKTKDEENRFNNADGIIYSYRTPDKILYTIYDTDLYICIFNIPNKEYIYVFSENVLIDNKKEKANVVSFDKNIALKLLEYVKKQLKSKEKNIVVVRQSDRIPIENKELNKSASAYTMAKMETKNVKHKGLKFTETFRMDGENHEYIYYWSRDKFSYVWPATASSNSDRITITDKTDNANTKIFDYYIYESDSWKNKDIPKNILEQVKKDYEIVKDYCDNSN